MSKFLWKLFGFVFVPAMLLGDYLTGHPAFLFIAGFFGIIVLLFAVFVIGLLLMTDSTEDTAKSVATGMLKRSLLYKIISNVVALSQIFYLLYVQAFWISTVFILIFITGFILRRMVIALCPPNKE